MANFISELKLKLDESTSLCAKLSRENIDLQLENEDLKENKADTTKGQKLRFITGIHPECYEHLSKDTLISMVRTLEEMTIEEIVKHQ